MLLLLALLAQSPGDRPQAPPEPPVVSLDRIRRGLERAEVRFELPPPDRRLFKVFVEQPRPFEFPVMWKDLAARGVYVHPPAPPEHHEFLSKVTPEDFRAGVLYPVGIPVLPVVSYLAREIGRAHRAGTERRLREQIRRELAGIEAARKAAGIR